MTLKLLQDAGEPLSREGFVEHARQVRFDLGGVAIDRAQAQGTRLAVLFLDLDGFKTINDTL